jgi:hypothetical protein
VKDKELGTLSILMVAVDIENKRQLSKWGIQTHDATEWLAITAEEFGEMSKAIVEYHFGGGNPLDAQDVVKEAIQTATLCLKIAEMFNEVARPT